MHLQEPWPQSRVAGLHSIVHIMPSQFGASPAGTHSAAWQHVAGTQSESEEHSASSCMLQPLTKTITNIKIEIYFPVMDVLKAIKFK